MKKFILFATLTFCILLLAGCAVSPNKELDTEKDTSVKEPVTEKDTSVKESVTETDSRQFSDEAVKSIDALRQSMGESKAQFGMAYIGYFDGAVAEETGIDFGQWFYSISSPLADEYPFVSETDQNHTVGTEGHLYCIIAKDDKSSISVSRKDGDNPLYTAQNGDPILVFCNIDGDAKKADTVVTIKTADGTEYRWEPTLDDVGFPNLLIGDERELLSWDFTPVSNPEGDFDLEGWLAEGWGGLTAVGLAYDENGTNWWISTWDNSVSYCLSFYLNESGNYDGEVTLECFYEGDSAVQAKWEGNWRIETEMEQPSRLYLDMKLTDGADIVAFENAATVSESYLTLAPQSGNNLLLVANDKSAVCPIFPEGVQAVELTFADG